MIEERLPHSARERRVVTTGALTIVAILAAKVTPALLDHRRALIASDVDVIASAARVDADLGALPALRDSLFARRVRLAALDSAVLDGGSEAAGSASLAEMLSDASKIAKTELGPVQLVTGERDSTHREPFARVAVRASLVGTVEGVMTFLALLEQGPTLISVRELTISRAEPRQPAAIESVSAELLVEGLVRAASERPRR